MYIFIIDGYIHNDFNRAAASPRPTQLPSVDHDPFWATRTDTLHPYQKVRQDIAFQELQEEDTKKPTSEPIQVGGKYIII